MDGRNAMAGFVNPARPTSAPGAPPSPSRVTNPVMSSGSVQVSQHAAMGMMSRGPQTPPPSFSDGK
jgi:hypothetical protein